MRMSFIYVKTFIYSSVVALCNKIVMVTKTIFSSIVDCHAFYCFEILIKHFIRNKIPKQTKINQFVIKQ